MKDYLWLIQTNKSSFFITVVGKWTQEEAAKKVHWVFAAMKLNIITMVPRRRATGPNDAAGIIYEDEENRLGFSFNAGRGIWEACGREVEFEAEQIRLRKEE